MPIAHRADRIACLLVEQRIAAPFARRAGYELTSQLRPFAQHQMVLLSQADLQGLRLRDAGISVVALRYGGFLSALLHKPAALTAFVQEVRLNGARLAVMDVPDQAAARDVGRQGAALLTFDSPPEA